MIWQNNHSLHHLLVSLPININFSFNKPSIQSLVLTIKIKIINVELN